MANYIQQRYERDRKMLDAGIKLGMQIASDYWQMAMRDPDTMGKDTFSRKRIEKIVAKTMQLDEDFSPAFGDEVDTDYYQEKMDAVLREIWGDDLVPFSERYDRLKKQKYDKPKKGWV